VPVPADFPDPSLPTHGPTVTLTGYSPSDRRLVFTPARH
jgi:3-phenylpropionate/trans-cinnamate dioxygenase ferredoxin reductase component